jgi:transposase
LTFEENIGEYISIDEVSLSKGELYTFVTNKKGRGKKGTLIASIGSTKSQAIIDVLEKIPLSKRLKVKEVTLDMANNMEAAVKKSFPNARLVTDRFHVVRLVLEALQHARIKLRWAEIDKENKAIKNAKNNKKKYEATTFRNDDTPKQLLARSRYIIAKKVEDWTKNQHERATILFENYPELLTYYKHSLELRSIYEETIKDKAEQRLKTWIQKTYDKKLEVFYTTANTILANFENITNFFDNRSTNANAESFNAKIKLFRANLRGVLDVSFFLFRMTKLFA